MSDILVIGSAGFVGSNFTNYAIQHTRYQLASVDNLRSYDGLHKLKNLQPALSSPSRHKFYLADANDLLISKRLFEIEKPNIVIWNILSTTDNWEESLLTFKKWLKEIRFAWHNPDKLIILYDSLYDEYSRKWYNHWELGLDEDLLSIFENWYIVAPCEIFGPRQATHMIANNIYFSLKDEEKALNDIGELYDIDTNKEWMYIKDYFDNLVSFLEDPNLESGKYSMLSNQWATDRELSKFIYMLVKEEEVSNFPWVPGGEEVRACYNGFKEYDIKISCELDSALEHTVVWYDKNRWFWAKKYE